MYSIQVQLKNIAHRVNKCITADVRNCDVTFHKQFLVCSWYSSVCIFCVVCFITIVCMSLCLLFFRPRYCLHIYQSVFFFLLGDCNVCFFLDWWFSIVHLVFYSDFDCMLSVPTAISVLFFNRTIIFQNENNLLTKTAIPDAYQGGQ